MRQQCTRGQSSNPFIRGPCSCRAACPCNTRDPSYTPAQRPGQRARDSDRGTPASTTGTRGTSPRRVHRGHSYMQRLLSARALMHRRAHRVVVSCGGSSCVPPLPLRLAPASTTAGAGSQPPRVQSFVGGCPADPHPCINHHPVSRAPGCTHSTLPRESIPPPPNPPQQKPRDQRPQQARRATRAPAGGCQRGQATALGHQTRPVPVKELSRRPPGREPHLLQSRVFEFSAVPRNPPVLRPAAG